MHYKVNIWKDDSFKREIVYTADNDIQAIQMASAATPDGSGVGGEGGSGGGHRGSRGKSAELTPH